METIYDLLYYLNKFDFTDNINDTDFEKLRCVKKMMLKKLEDYNVSKLFDVFSIVHNSFITFTVGELQEILIETDTLRENTLYLISFKHFVKSNVDFD